MRKNILVIICSLCALQIIAQNRTLQLTCNNSPFQEGLECRLTLRDNFGHSQKYYYPAVYNADKTRCSFTFPDSIFQKYSSCDVLKQDTLYTTCIFRVIHNADTTLFISSRLFWEDADTMALRVRFESQDTVRTLVNKYVDIKYTIENPSQEVLLGLVSINNDHVKYREESREQRLARYRELIAKYPHSRSLLQSVYEYYRLFSIEELNGLISLFSNELLQTYSGKKLTALIDSNYAKFENQLLQNCRTDEKEPVIINPGKYTFVIFSASWCAPCHKLIPLLKELYSKKKDVIDFVYISLDEEKTRNSWKQLLDKEQIPWRALSVNDVTKVRQDYKVPVIPYSYLVSPSGSFQRLDIRNDEDLKKLENIQL